ncbi:MAG TPA: MFS transporter [Anaerolineae bacterium]|nr:MFS transporter [Anaerolineae bacterium]
MPQTRSRYRWFVVAVFFCFVLLHQADRLLISPLTTPIMETFGINEAQMGAVSSLALVVAAILYPIWGYLYDRFSRSRLLALASFIWGSTTWLNALAPNYPTFLATRASTGVDDASYPGLFSLLSDYFGPRMRGKVYGLIQVANPVGFMLGTVLATMLGGAMGWRSVFFITGGAGIVLAVVIFVGVREPSRGQAEPEMAGLEEIAAQRIDKQVALGLLRKRSYLLLLSQGFFGVFPWQVLTFWFFRYLETERGYTSEGAMMAMLVAIVTLSAGYFLGGTVGDFFFRRTPRGRLLTAMVGVLAGAVLLALTLIVPVENGGISLPLLALTCLNMSVASPNVIATVQDVTEPEVRGTAQAIMSFAENFGSALAPWLAGLIALSYSLHVAILVICSSAWLLCALLFGFAALLIPRDVERLRQTMRARAEAEQALA